MSSISNDDVSNLTILGGGSLLKPSVAPDMSLLEAFPNRFLDRNYVIQFSFPEFTSLCPVTGQPDFGTIYLEYIPDQLCIESKSFKLYMFAFRNHQSFMETVTNKILDDLYTFLQPRWIRIKGLFAPRGAVKIHVYAEKFKNSTESSEIKNAVTNWNLERNNL